MNSLDVQNVVLGYNDIPVIAGLTTQIPIGSVTAIVGPNGCGKSTLLKGLAGLLRPVAGQFLLNCRKLSSYSIQERAKMIAFLPQTPVAPSGLSVYELISRGRHPHRRWLRGWNQLDHDAVEEALDLTGLDNLRHREISQLSGGQRQRAWLALVLAQQTDFLLLDEPTTYLDISHQIHVLDICRDLNTKKNRTVIAVLHDLNLAFKYADHIVVMDQGKVVTVGRPDEIDAQGVLQEVFKVTSTIIEDPMAKKPHIITHERTC